MKQPNAQDLKAYLKSYIEKCMDFERTKEKHYPPDFYGVIENGLFKDQRQALAKIAAESLDSTEAYWSVREKVHQYQRDNGISGVVWKEITYRGQSVRVPSVDWQLVFVPGDKEILIAATPEILNWWAQVTEGMDLWRSVPPDDEWETIQLEQILVSAPMCEWAEVCLWDHPETTIVSAETGERWVEPTLELNLQLCWGISENDPYTMFPESEWFHATRRKPEQSELEDIFIGGGL